ncbi:sigma 54-interacting transcriptional regulator [Candidatus Methylocalor cossyra]|uniref:Diguanylate cyclase n=1 Tax=Candidatus Methylocalor cossyra TaxID=3108543 RepID=A0ABP1CBQ1_9GAMM
MLDDPTAKSFAEHLLHHLPVSAFVLDTRHRVLLWNRACEQLTGIPAAEMIGTDRHWQGFYRERRPCLGDLFLDRALGRLPEWYERAGPSSVDAAVLHTENWCPMPDGRRLYLIIEAGPILDARGEVVAVVETQRDMTAQKLAEQALAESERRFSTLFDSAMDAILAVDGEGRITLFNAAAERIFRCAASLALGQPAERFIARAARPLFSRLLALGDAPAQRPFWAPEGLTAQRADGEEFPIEATFSPMEIAGQKSCAVILRDVNDRREAERRVARLQAEKGYLREVASTEYNFAEIVGESPEIRAVFEHLRMVAGTDTPVLLLGETGTGKELFAEGLHHLSGRREALLVKVNCAALPAELIESELFGHEKGAFTGATQQRRGRFELAHRGTLFLDEVGELPLALQAKLLRVLQEQRFERVGGSATLEVDVRIVAATNRDLAAEVEAGRFRRDLFFRLNVFPIRIPPLRERRTDIPLLARHFLAKFARKLGKPIAAIAPAAMERLLAYPWPGNVRELQNVIERAVILAQGPQLELGPALDLRLAVNPPEPAGTLEEVERNHILRVLEETRWVIAGPRGAAAALGLAPSTLRSRMQKLGIVRRR